MAEIDEPPAQVCKQDTYNKMDKVFFTNITRTCNKSNEDLYELLKVDPAIPVPVNPLKNNSCDFQPRNDKQYIPKKKNKLKVNTVRDIRNLFEKDVMNDLPSELEKQQNLLLRKIKGGTLKDEKTKSLAKNMLNANKPMTKSSWQMLMNINPDNHAHSMQFVLWNGKQLRINGSKGGKNKFICNYDVGKKREPFKQQFSRKVFKKKGLLRNSLSVNFKPGPLTRKKYLDNSYQKYHVGDIEVVNLPKPGLEIQPLYGSSLDPTICNFVNSLREENGTITEKWAEFAVSVVGSINGQKNDNNSITFDLNYQHDKTRLLMRRDYENRHEFKEHKIDPDSLFNAKHENNIVPEVHDVMKGILDAVEISLIQDDLFMEDDELRDNCQSEITHNIGKDKIKRKYCELDRLAVTVIRLSEDTSANEYKKCHNSYCALGCVCSSLQSTINLKGHCGRLDCMFKCRCDFSNQKLIEGLDNDCPDLLPGLLNLNNTINCNLSKEEQKFHQTVILAGDKSILLKAKKRNTKSSKKYADFYSSLSLKPESKTKQAVLAIIEPRLNCDNIEPLCMVHNLYKCFCKGRFTESIISKEKEILTTETVKESEKNDTCDKRIIDPEEHTKEKEHNCSVNRYNTRIRRETIKNDVITIDLDDESDSCSRVRPYHGRKFSEGYYKNANEKILDMEVNDTSLRKKLLHLTGKSEKEKKDTTNSGSRSGSLLNDDKVKEIDKVGQPVKTPSSEVASQPTKPIEESHAVEESKVVEESHAVEEANFVEDRTPKDNLNTSKLMGIDSSTTKRLTNKPKLIAWLESSYQQYKRRLDLGCFKATLEAPRKGKVALYPWDFILSRYSERKNLFLVTKEPPYRIFMAVNSTNPFFQNCINIDDIRFADLNKYPTSVKNLLTNTSDLKDYFCILFGLSHCWEFIGSVTKVGDSKDKHLEDEVLETSITQEPDEISNYDSDSRTDSVKIEDIERLSMNKSEEAGDIQQFEKSPEQLKSESSKWFIMTIENDFTEIQFYNRGFFVKYASIIQAINVARTSGKTVRLSSQKLADNNGPQFGIYAVPSSNDYCVFVGPYELDEPLGIETLKSTFVRKAKMTRGVWITTGKVDNIKVIDNPLSFIPTRKEMVPLESDSVRTEQNQIKAKRMRNSKPAPQISQDIKDTDKKIAKVVKPIKIRKSNGFYHLSKKSLLKSFNFGQSSNQHTVESINTAPVNIKPRITDMTATVTALSDMPVIIAGCETLDTVVAPLLPISRVANIQIIKQVRPVAEVAPQIKIAAVYSEVSAERPVAEVAPQIKIASVYSEASPEKQEEAKKKERGMFILKPEEINQRIENKLNSPTVTQQTAVITDDHENTMDVEYFLDNSDICPEPVNLFSDQAMPAVAEDANKKVFIECKNIDLGVIPGIQNKKNQISFTFPGFKATEFYEPEVAFTKINQVMSRKVYMHKDMCLEWHIVDSVNKLKNSRLLDSEDFGHNNVILTERGLEKISENSFEKYTNIKTYSRKDRSSQSPQVESLGETSESSRYFETECQVLEDETEGLLTETVTRKHDIVKSIIEATDSDRNEYANTLSKILSNSQD